MSEKRVVYVESGLGDLIPLFFENRRDDIATIRKYLTAGEMDRIMHLGSTLKTIFTAYGFQEMIGLATSVENAARQGLRAEVEGLMDQLERYVTSLEIKPLAANQR